MWLDRVKLEVYHVTTLTKSAQSGVKKEEGTRFSHVTRFSMSRDVETK